MATYVLVHGAWHGSWCWERVRTLLQEAGHIVFTPTLTGVGERCHLSSPSVNLDTHIADVINLIDSEGLSSFVLCGHSYGGCVVTGVVDRVAYRISAVAYIDAFLLEDGQSLFDSLPMSTAEAMRQQAKTDGEGWEVLPPSAESLGVNLADRVWVDALFTTHPIECFEQRIALAGSLNSPQNFTYALATDNPLRLFTTHYLKAKSKGWKTDTFTCGHDIMIDNPEKLAQLMIGLA